VLALVGTWSGWAEFSALGRLIVIGALGPGLFALVVLLLRPAEMRERISYVRRVFKARAA
jgi:hypothetical protein